MPLQPTSIQASSLFEGIHRLLRQLGEGLFLPGWDETALSDLIRLGEPAALPYLAGALLSPRARIRSLATQGCERLLGRLASADLIQLDWHFRRPAFGKVNAYFLWSRARPEQIARSLESEESGLTLARLSTFHPNGYVRQLSIEELSRRGDAADLRYFLLRLNDWVPAVREAARFAAEQRLSLDSLEVLFRELPLLAHLGRLTRTDLGEFLEQVDGLLRLPEAERHWRAALASPIQAVRRTLVPLLLRSRPLAMQAILTAGLDTSDAHLRAVCASALSRSLPRPEAARELKRWLDDPLPTVRRLALEAVITAEEDGWTEAVLRALFDRAAAPRSLAIWSARREGIDAAELYRERLRDRGPGLATALAGLAATGASGDENLAEGCLAHPHARVRRAALITFAALSPTERGERAFAALEDPARSVVRQATRILLPHARQLGRARLWPAFAAASDTLKQRALLPLLARLPRWDALTCLLDAAEVPEREVAQVAAGLLSRWTRTINRSFEPPGPGQIAGLRKRLATSRDRVDPDLSRSLALLLKSFEAG